MKYLVLLIFLFSPVYMQDDMTPEEEAEYAILLHSKEIENAKRELVTVKERLDATLLRKQNYTDILQQERVRNQEYSANSSQLRKDIQACENDLEQCENHSKQLNDEKSKLNELKNEKERLLREIEKCQPVSKNLGALVSQCSILSGPISFLSKLVDYKSSVIYNLLSGLLGFDGEKS